MLIAGVSVNRRHQAFFDAKGVVEHLGQDGETVCRA